jgi:hypothetical protein
MGTIIEKFLNLFTRDNAAVLIDLEKEDTTLKKYDIIGSIK